MPSDDKITVGSMVSYRMLPTGELVPVDDETAAAERAKAPVVGRITSVEDGVITIEAIEDVTDYGRPITAPQTHNDSHPPPAAATD